MTGLQIRPTRDGWMVLGLSASISLVALASSNNLLYMIASVLWALLLVSVVLGQWNLRGLSVLRLLPMEFFAEHEASGRLQIHNSRRWLSGLGLEIEDVASTARGFCEVVEPGRSAQVFVRWRFERRGRMSLSGVAITSTFPFGLTRHRLWVSLPADVVVFPRPGAGAVRTRAGSEEGSEHGSGGRGLDGDFAGIRAYRPGDRPTAIHWRTTARASEVVVVEHAGDADPYVEVVLRPGQDRHWERDISRATGEILRAFGMGCPVGMVVGGGDGADARFRPGTGGRWRRALLEVLALQPGRRES